eukprot:CAMPEP_0171632230 /NCGR_PEP_ID=MMETSP0990-20121206/24262_1 /TAXON_ID=483369 /ORGANISM="non described non described, Strain CCMP2098" /LENGTH=97 /DNA_ID=CAMNT_0012202273 /DNA_START=14 /DNA_END=307 /DNA_ORIENTATION=+
MSSLNMPTLLAASGAIAKDCSEANKSFLMCKKANADPEGCLAVGSVVMQCAAATVAKLSAAPYTEPFEAYTKCIDKAGGELSMCSELKAALGAVTGE